MLRNDVVAAVRDETFHIYPVRSIDEALAVLSGCEAGELGPGLVPALAIPRAASTTRSSRP
jgi:hypothetical protein